MPAFAQDVPTATTVQTNLDAVVQNVNLLWIVIGAALVVFMQAGFALVETGFFPAKNAAHGVGVNLAIFGVGVGAVFLSGGGVFFGGDNHLLHGGGFGGE